VARTVLRIYGADAEHVGVLNLTEMSAPDARKMTEGRLLGEQDMQGRGSAHCPEDDSCQDGQQGGGEREAPAG